MLHVVDQYLIYHLLLRNVEHIGMEKEMDETRLSGTPPTPDFLLKDKKTVSPYQIDKFSFDDRSYLSDQALAPSKSSHKIRVSVPPLVQPNSSIPYLDPKSPRCRLSRPGSSTVRVIPPLRGLEREVCCAHCGGRLFCLANVLRIQDTKVQTSSTDDHEKGSGNSLTSSPSSSSASSSTPVSISFPSLSSQILTVEMKDLKKDFKLNLKYDPSPIEKDFKYDLKGTPNILTKDIKRDLKRDCEGEHKQEQRDPDRTVLPSISRGYSDRKVPPQSCRGAGAKRFDFDFEKPSGSVSVKNSSGRSSSGFRVDFDEGQGELSGQRTTTLSTLSEDGLEKNASRESEVTTTDDNRKQERDRSGSAMNMWGRRSVSEDALSMRAGWLNTSGPEYTEGSPGWSDPEKMVVVTEDDEVSKGDTDSSRAVTGPLSLVTPDIAGTGTGIGPLNPMGSNVLELERPQSVEKRRWLARMSLLSAGSTPAVSPTSSSGATATATATGTAGTGTGSGSGSGSGSTVPHLPGGAKQQDSQSRMRQMAHDDEEAMRLTFGGAESSFGEVQHLYLEYLGWMDPNGTVLGLPSADSPDHDTETWVESDRDVGEIKCRHCRRVIGGWTWRPTAKYVTALH